MTHFANAGTELWPRRGFNVTLAVLQDPEKRAKIVGKLREFAGCADEVVRILNGNSK